MTLEELKKEFKDQGFKIDGDSFTIEFPDPNTVINGQHPIKRFEMTYICEGWISDVGDSDSDTGEPLYQFDVLGPNREPVVTICIETFEDFTKLIRWKG